MREMLGAIVSTAPVWGMVWFMWTAKIEPKKVK